jgi:4-amino-4-deoxy-L-arabinose transferase-like glycosyltransferase
MRIAPVALASLCAVVLFTGLGRIGFVDDREARDAEVARELLERREVFVPLYAHEPRFEKPVLAYSFDVLGCWLTPGSPRASRRLRAVAAVALVLLTALIGARHFGARAGGGAACVLVTSLGLPLATRTDGTQLLGSLLGWVGCAGIADALFGRGAGRDLRLIAACGALGATVVVAGPLPGLWPFAALALYLVLARAHEGWTATRVLCGLAIMAGFALPWYGAMAGLHGWAFIAHAVFFPYGLQPRGAWYSGLVFALPYLAVAGFPWSALLPGAAAHAATWWRRVPPARLQAARAATGPGATEGTPISSVHPVARERREESAAHFFVACLGAALLPMLFYPGPGVSAALPALPAAALLCGRFLDHLFEDSARVRRPLANAVRMLALVGTAMAIACASLAPRLPEAASTLRLLGSLVLVTSWAPLLADLIGRRRIAAALLLLPVAVAAPVVSLALAPALEDHLNARSVASALAVVAPAHAPLAVFGPVPPSLRLYARRNLVDTRSLAEAIAACRAGDGYAYLVFPPSQESRLLRGAPGPAEILLRTPALVLARWETRS